VLRESRNAKNRYIPSLRMPLSLTAVSHFLPRVPRGKKLFHRQAASRRHGVGFPSFIVRSNRMSIIIMIIVGFIVGLIARAIMPGDQKMGFILTTVLGIVGALVAGYLGQALGWYVPGEPAGWIASVVGAIIVLFVVGLFRKKSA